MALLVVFWGLLQLDLPLVRYLRSLHNPWLDQAGDVGNRLGSGPVLIVVSGSAFILGVLLKSTTLRAAGIESMFAHAAAGLTSQAIKHIIGRPRPRLMHGDKGFLLGPSFDSGLDSFPSGHASASFAVATVFARRFPNSGWIWYGAASLVAVSRVMRGSHFYTDVMFGIGLGILVGCVLSNPLLSWRTSLLQGLALATPFLVAVFALTWIAVYPSFNQSTTLIMMVTGVLLLLIGISTRLHRRLKASWSKGRKLALGLTEANLLIAVGLASTSGSTLITLITVLVSLAYWLRQQHVDHNSLSDLQQDPSQPTYFNYRRAFIELSLAVMLILMVLSIQQMKGMLPILS